VVTPLLIWGATGQAKVLAEFAPDLGFEVKALIDRDPAVPSPFPGLPIFRGKEGLDWFTHRFGGGPLAAAAAIGGWRWRDRLEVLSRLRAHGFETPALVHPHAWVAKDVQIGEGSHVLGGACISTGARLGEGVIAGARCNIDHECVIGAGAHIGPGAVLAGCVETGDGAFVGPGAVVVARARIGANAIVGAGAVVIGDIPEAVIAYGAPARVIRPVESRAKGANREQS
jgi:sugar O-acyltransferase (sialic acid O-acetyltransferase NeuD family)